MKNRTSLILRETSILLVLAVLFGVIPARAEDTPDAPHSEEIVRLWAVCPNARGYVIDWAHGVYLLAGVRNGRIPKIHSHEIKRAFPLEQWADWVGNVSASQHVVLIGAWDHTFRFYYTVIDKHDPLDFRVGPRARTMYDFWGVIDGEFRIISLGNPEAKQPGDPLTVRVFDPETLTVSEPGREAWQHILREDSVRFVQGRLVFSRRFDGELCLSVPIPEEFHIEGKGFGLYWNDRHHALLRTSRPANADGITLLLIAKDNGQVRRYDMDSRPAGFRVSWPWVLCGYVDERMTGTTAHESFVSNPLAPYWRVLNLENGNWGHFSFEVRCQNTGLDISDDILFWRKDEELWAVDLREAVEEETTQPQLVWQDPLVPHIVALFYKHDGGGAQCNEDDPGESRER